MKQIILMARFQIHDGSLEAFKLLAEKCVAIVRAKDTGTTQYNWFYSADETECVVQEMYVDSEATLLHIANVTATLGGILQIADLVLELYGDPSPTLREAIKGLPHKLYHYSLGL